MCFLYLCFHDGALLTVCSNNIHTVVEFTFRKWKNLDNISVYLHYVLNFSNIFQTSTFEKHEHLPNIFSAIYLHLKKNRSWKRGVQIIKSSLKKKVPSENLFHVELETVTHLKSYHLRKFNLDQRLPSWVQWFYLTKARKGYSSMLTERINWQKS